jgi:hypothetical protein
MAIMLEKEHKITSVGDVEEIKIKGQSRLKHPKNVRV